MKPYNQLSQGIQVMLEGYVASDPYGLKPSTLYKNIAGSLHSSSPEQVAKIFEVSETLCEMIQKANDKPLAQWSISRKQFEECTDEYKSAQQDIVNELIALGDDVAAIDKWISNNNADFGVIL
jgi:hypothetical protein